MKSIIKTIGFTIILLSFSLVTCFAVPNNINKIIESESINASLDKNDVLASHDKYKNDIKRIMSQSYKIDATSIRTDSFVKAYKFNTTDIVSGYKNLKEFDKLISNKYVWLSPIINTNNICVSILTMDKGMSVDEYKKLPLKYKSDSDKAEALAMVKENEDKWIVAKIGPSLSEDQIDFLTDSSKVENLLIENNISTISQIKFVLEESHHTNILYIKSGNDEYGVPFGTRTDLTGLQNGKLYKINDIVETLDKSFADTKNTSEGTFGGGTSTIRTSRRYIIIAVISLLLLASAGFLVTNNKLRHNK